MGNVQWTDGYGDLIADSKDDDDGLIPMIGMRMLIGITRTGEDTFVWQQDCDGPVEVSKTLHMLRMVIRTLEDREMARYGCTNVIDRRQTGELP